MKEYEEIYCSGEYRDECDKYAKGLDCCDCSGIYRREIKEPVDIGKHGVREDIAKILYSTAPDATQCWEDLPSYLQGYWLGKVDKILSLKYPNGQPKLGIIREDQSLPERMYQGVLPSQRKFVNSIQQEMLKANFKRIEEK